MARSAKAKLSAIEANFYNAEISNDDTFQLPSVSKGKFVLEKTFHYRSALFELYLRPFLEAFFSKDKTALARLTAILGTSPEERHCLQCIKERTFSTAILEFDRFVLPLDASSVSGLPLYFSPRPKASGAIEIATQRHPLLQLLHHPSPRPQAEAVNTVLDAVGRISKSQAEKEGLDWYASIKFDGHAAVWTGKGLISKTGKSAIRFVPPTLKRELLERFPDDIVLGEIVVTESEAQTIENLRKRLDGKPYRAKADISGLYAESSDAKTAETKNKKKKLLGSLMFLVYDIISYRHRGLTFKQRYAVLEKQAKGLTRIEVVEQVKVKSIDVQKTANSSEFPLGLAPRKGERISPGMQQLNLMVLGCLTHNQEGIFLRPDVPFYDLYQNSFKAVKLKPRLIFAAQVAENPEKQSAKFYKKRGVIYEGTAVVKVPADLLFRRSTEEIEEAPFDETRTLKFKYQGKPDLTGASFISIVNVYDKFGARIAEPPDTFPRPLHDLLPPGVGYLAQIIYEDMKRKGIIRDVADVQAEFEEAKQLIQLGNVLNFRDFPVVVADKKLVALSSDNEKFPATLGTDCIFTDEPNNESLFQLLYSLAIDADLGSATSFNRWIPALRRHVDGKSEAWLALLKKQNMRPAGPKMQKVNAETVPRTVPLYYVKAAKSKVFFYVQSRGNLPTNSGIYVDLKRTAPRPVFFVQADVIDTRPSMPAGWNKKKIPKNQKGETYTRPMLDETFVDELRSVEEGGLVEYTRNGKMANIAAVIGYLNAINDERTIDDYDPDEFVFNT